MTLHPMLCWLEFPANWAVKNKSWLFGWYIFPIFPLVIGKSYNTLWESPLNQEGQISTSRCRKPSSTFAVRWQALPAAAPWRMSVSGWAAMFEAHGLLEVLDTSQVWFQVRIDSLKWSGIVFFLRLEMISVWWHYTNLCWIHMHLY